MAGGCCGDDVDDCDKKLKPNTENGEEEFTGPSGKPRQCTDVICMVMLILVWIIMTILGIMGSLSNNTAMLTNGWDYVGRFCGEEEVLYYINTNLQGVCIDECPTVTDPLTVYCVDGVDPDITEYANEVNSLKGRCMYQLETQTYNRRCIPTEAAVEAIAAATGNEGISFSTDSDSFVGRIISDIWTCKTVIIVTGFVLGLFASFTYLYVLKLEAFVTAVIWMSCGSVSIFAFGLGGYAYYIFGAWSAEDPQLHSDNEMKGVQVLSIIFMVVGALWTCFLIFMRSRIALAVALVKCSSDAISAMPVIVFWPIIQVLGLVAFIIPWMVWCIFIATMGEFGEGEEICSLTGGDTGCTETKKFTYGATTEYYGWYMLFCYFWTSEFIVAIGQIVVAMAISKWYFTKGNKLEVIGNETLLWAVKTSFYYHMGTAAFGSLLIAIIKMIRAIVMYIQNQAKTLTKGNKLAQQLACVIFGCINCCLWCLEKFMKFLNKNAYVQTAIYGTSFMTSAKKAFFLILRNVARITAVSIVSEFILVIGKLFICMFSGFVCYLWITQQEDVYPVSSPNGAVLFSMLVAYGVAQYFNEVFGMCMTTLLQCFVADEEMCTGFADENLRKFINQKGGKSGAKKAVAPQELD